MRLHVAESWGECLVFLMPNTHRRRRREETVESRRVGGVYWALVNVVDYRYQLTVTVIVKCQMLRGKPKSLQMIKLRLIPKNNLYMGSKARDTRKILKQPEMTPTRHWL